MTFCVVLRKYFALTNRSTWSSSLMLVGGPATTLPRGGGGDVAVAVAVCDRRRTMPLTDLAVHFHRSSEALLPIPAHDHHGRAQGRQLQGDAAPDAGPAPGHQRDPATEEIRAKHAPLSWRRCCCRPILIGHFVRRPRSLRCLMMQFGQTRRGQWQQVGEGRPGKQGRGNARQSAATVGRRRCDGSGRCQL
jgi:hypothetical protein